MVGLQGYVYTVPKRDSQILCPLLTQSHRCAVTLGYGYVAPLVL